MRAGKLQAVYVTRGSHRGLHVRISPEMETPLLPGLVLDTAQVNDD